MTNEYIVTVEATVDLYIGADSIQQAEEIAETIWYDRLKYNGDWDITDVEEV